MFLIVRQFRTHSALAAMRAEKIEIEHARLIAEAELLKKRAPVGAGPVHRDGRQRAAQPAERDPHTLFTMREIALSSGLTLDGRSKRIQRSIARCDRIIGDSARIYPRSRAEPRAGQF